MNVREINKCPGTLAAGFSTYSKTCLNRVFNGKKVYHILPYSSPTSNEETDDLFEENRKRISISGVQEKFSVILEKNKLRLVIDGEQGTHILKPIPNAGKSAEEMPANEHLTMQIARQLYGIETAENAMIFFKDGIPAYITKRFDVKDDGSKWAQDDFATLAGRTPQTHGEHYKYLGNYLDLFHLMKKHVPAYIIESSKLLKVIIFNYLFSNGDAHFKNFSLLETSMGDHRLSPAYDLLNSRIHISDRDFSLDDGLLPQDLAQGKVREQIVILGKNAGLSNKTVFESLDQMLSQSDEALRLIEASFLSERIQRNYWQTYQTRLKRLLK